MCPGRLSMMNRRLKITGTSQELPVDVVEKPTPNRLPVDWAPKPRRIASISSECRWLSEKYVSNFGPSRNFPVLSLKAVLPVCTVLNQSRSSPPATTPKETRPLHGVGSGGPWFGCVAGGLITMLAVAFEGLLSDRAAVPGAPCTLVLIVGFWVDVILGFCCV